MEPGKNSNTPLFIVLGILVVVVIGVFISATSGGGGGGGGAAVMPDAGTTPNASNTPTTPTAPTAPTAPAAPGANTQLPEPKDLSEVTLDAAFDASTSADVPTVTEVRGSLAARNLEEGLLTADFDINGTYSDTTTLDKDSNDRFPSYVVQYLTADNNPWFIYINNGNYYALPLFDVATSSGAQVIVSETDFVTGYDGSNNTYLNTVPPADELIVLKVPVINKATLDGLTVEELEKL